MADLVEVWRYQGGFSLSHDLVIDVAVAADNSVFLLGFQLDNYGTSGSDFAAVKIDADGDILWEWKEGSDGHDVLLSAAAVADGVVGGGYFNGTWNEVPSAGGADFAVIKLYSNSSVAWRWHEGTDEDDFMSTAVQTVDGNVVVAGYTLGSWDETSYGWRAVAAAKLNADDGKVIWKYQTEATVGEGTFVQAAAVRGDGSVVLGGSRYRAITTTAGEDDWATDFLALALDEHGNELWRWQDGPGTGHSFVTGIAAFDDGSVLLAGTTEKSWLVDDLMQGNFSVAKLNASGYLEWSWQNGTMFDDEFTGAAVGIDDSVILCGFSSGSWAGTQAGNEFDKDFVAMSINAEGDILWRYQAGTTADDVFNSVAVRPDGLIVLGGWTVGTWTAPETSDLYADFAAVLLNASSLISLTTPSPTKDSSSSEKGSKRSKDTDSGDSAGLIVGSSIGGVAAFALLVACCFCLWDGGKHTREANPPGSSTLPAAPAPIAPGRHVSNVAVVRVVAINPHPTYTDTPPEYSAVA